MRLYTVRRRDRLVEIDEAVRNGATNDLRRERLAHRIRRDLRLLLYIAIVLFVDKLAVLHNDEALSRWEERLQTRRRAPQLRKRETHLRRRHWVTPGKLTRPKDVTVDCRGEAR